MYLYSGLRLYWIASRRAERYDEDHVMKMNLNFLNLLCDVILQWNERIFFFGCVVVVLSVG